MKYFLEPEGWPCDISEAPNGLLARVRKGKMFLFLKSDGAFMNVPPFVMEVEGGHLTKVTGTVTPVKLRTVK